MQKSICFIALLLVLVCGKAQAQITPHQYNGQETLSLVGEWKFFWEKQYQSDPSLLKSPDFQVLTKPGPWNDMEIEGETLTGKGYATYATEVIADRDYDRLALYLPGFYSAHIALVNGEKVNEIGTVGQSPETSKVNWTPQLVPIVLKKGVNTIVIEVSNFHHSKGGFYVDVEIGQWDFYEESRLRNWLIDIFTAGAFIMIGFFFLGMFLFWRPSSQYLIYTVFTIAYAIRILSSGNHILRSLVPDLPWQWAVGIEYFTLYLVFWSSLAVVSKYLTQMAHRIIAIYYIGLTVSILVLPLDIYSQFLTFAIVSGLGIYLWIVFNIIKKRRQLGRREFWSVLLFMIFALGGWVFAFLIHSNEVGIFLLDPNLFRFLAVLTLGLVVSERYSTDYDQLNLLKEEALASAKTIELQLEELNEQKLALTDRNNKIETLFKEVHHRVKNNLQLIYSLLDASSAEAAPVSKGILEDSQARVATMSLIHQNLYMHDDLATIPFGGYVDDLVSQLAEIHDVDEIELNTEIEDLEFDVDTMIPLGLAINELVNNSFKYSVIEGTCKLFISCKKVNTGEYELFLKDKGKNLPKPLEELVATGYGLRLAHRLCTQLMGSLSHHYENGNHFKICFWDTDKRKEIL